MADNPHPPDPHDPGRFGEWRPMPPHEVAHLFAALAAPWWIAGGWAIDLFLGTSTRAHEDIDVQVARRDQAAVRALLRGWDVQEAGHPTTPPNDWPFREWRPNATLSPDIHDVWCRPTAGAPWALQLMVAELTGTDWVFRRDSRIRRPITTLGLGTADGIPYLAPEIQLLYKAKAPRPKDEADFSNALPFLDSARRQWLADALLLAHPDHPWLARLGAETGH
ncbi:MAG TPA: aminoglycoside adenylyltransferase [Ktedonobacterales bacterium]|jgi:hypothetical protein